MARRAMARSTWDQSVRVGTETAALPITDAAVVNRTGPLGAEQVAVAQLLSEALGIVMVPPAPVSPAGGTLPDGAKANARAGNPVWFEELDVRKRTFVESGASPVQLGTSRPQTNWYVAPDRLLPLVVVMFTLLKTPQGETPELQGVPALGSKTNEPLAVPPSPNVTPEKTQLTGVALATRASMQSATEKRTASIEYPP